jgi:hypothetical protein
MDAPQITPQPRKHKMGRIYALLALGLILLIFLVPKFASADSTVNDETVLEEEFIVPHDSLWNTIDDFSKQGPIEIGHLKVQSVDKFFNQKDRTEPYELDIDFPQPIQSVTQL